MVEIITVHGTFAQDEKKSDEGNKWWQAGSDFLTRLQSYIADDIVFTPFHWSGANSERKRRLAARQLSQTVLKRKEPPVILAHSHGGSVSIHALARLATRWGGRQASSVRAVVNIGTPFLWFKNDWNFVSRFNLVGRILLVTALLFSIEAIRSGFQYPSYYDSGWIGQIVSFARVNTLTIIALLIFTILAFLAIPSWRRSAALRKGVVKATYGQLVTNLTHRQDEAIGALSAGTRFRPKFLTFKGMFLSAFSAVTALVLLVEVFAGFLPTDVIADDSWYHSAFDEIEKSGTERIFSIQTGPVGAGLKFQESAGTTLRDHLVSRTYTLATDLVAIPFQQVSDKFQFAASAADFRDIDPEVLQIISPALSATTFYVAEDAQDEFFQAFYEAISHYAKRKSDEGPYGPLSNLSEPPDTESSEFDASAINDFFYDYEFGANNNDLHSVEFPPTLVIRRLQDIQDPAWLSAGTRFFGTPAFDRNAFSCLKYDLRNKDRCNPLREILDGGRKRPLEWVLKDFRTFQTEVALNIPIIARRDITATAHRSGWAPLGRPPSWTRVYDAVLFSATIALVLSLILTPLLSQFLVLTLRNSAYGNDVSGEHIVGVARDDDFSAFPIGFIPAEVEQEMLRQSIEDASSAIDRIRHLVFGEMMDSKKTNDPVALAMKFEKSELIHNAYFHSEKFIKYLAAILVVRHGLSLSELGRGDETVVHFIKSLEMAVTR